jgi:hypothetical protein
MVHALSKIASWFSQQCFSKKSLTSTLSSSVGYKYNVLSNNTSAAVEVSNCPDADLNVRKEVFAGARHRTKIAAWTMWADQDPTAARGNTTRPETDA